MRARTVRPLLSTSCLAAGLIALAAGAAHAAGGYNVTNLVSNGSVPAAWNDPNLVNAWGVAYSPTGPFWISDNGSGLATVYNGAGAPQSLVVTVAPPNGSPAGTTSAPTGQVFNSSTGFNVTSGGKTGKAVFLFDTEDGTISGWAPSVNGSSSIIAVDNSNGGAGAVYKGLAMGTTGGQSYLYATNFRAGDVEMYNSSFGLTKTFTDPNVAAGYAPFNDAVINGKLYVTFALQNGAKHDDVSGAGHGYVDIFNLDGTFDKRLITQGVLNSPWALDLAPANFGKFSNDLLVGNFGDGMIDAFDPTSGKFLGELTDANGQPIVENALWDLVNGNGGKAGSPNRVYFTSGVPDEGGGLFGSISALPEPGTWAMMLLGVAAIGFAARRRAALAVA